MILILESTTMLRICLVIIVLIFLSISCCTANQENSACFLYHHHLRSKTREFKQKTNRFIRFEEESNTWVELELPYDLVSCTNGSCNKVGSIKKVKEYVPEESESLQTVNNGEKRILKGNFDMLMPLRKRVSLTKMSEMSIWITGESGSIYERFWNGVQWVIVPHDLPDFAGAAVSVFFVNQSILALSESGLLYQMQLNEYSQPAWLELPATFDSNQNATIHIKSGVVSNNKERVYFCTKNGSLLELAEVQPPRWINHKRPSGANVAAVADAATVKPDVVFIISSAGDLYEYDQNSKPPWRKHVWTDKSVQNTSLMPVIGCCVQGLHGAYSMSLFLITKAGNLVERRLHQRRWKWISHQSPEEHLLTSVVHAPQETTNENSFSLFLTTASGSILEYQMPKHSGSSQEVQTRETWIDHEHPKHAKAARGIPGLHYQVGRTIYSLDDGRLGELHLSGIGGQSSGPSEQVNIRRRASRKYIWSVLEAPESEGWNGEYCTEGRGPSNCISGINEEPNDIVSTRSVTRKKTATYLIPEKSSEDYKFNDKWVNANFRLRLMHRGRSFFLVTGRGLTLEYVYSENAWLWLRHEHTTPMKGVVGTYNASLFLIDINGNLMLRERSNDDLGSLGWMNCTAMKKGKQITSGPPWDEMPNKPMKITAEDSLFFVSKSGKLLQFTVANRKFKWKDCKTPPNTKIASIVDKEGLRENIVFVVGRNGRLYQYNKLTGIWHEHYQSQHLILSRLPGTAMRISTISLKGSIFMISHEGGLVEYHWNTQEGWTWVEHGRPHESVSFVAAPGQAFDGSQLFLIGSDGNVYLRFVEQAEWKWKDYGFPSIENMAVQEGKAEKEFDPKFTAKSDDNEQIDVGHLNKNCNPRVAETRPIPFGEDSVIFELRDGRLAEIRRGSNRKWAWMRTIASPTSLCMANYWTAPAG